MHEEPRHLHQQEDEQRAAEHVLRPAPADRERGQRQEEERGDRDRAGSPEHLRREPEVVRAGDDELVGVLLQAAQPLGVARVVRARLVHERPQPEQHRDDRHGRSEVRAPLAVREHDERHEHEERVRRVDERERAEHDDGRRVAAREEQRDRGRREDLARGVGGLRELRVRAAVSGREAEERHLRERER